MFDNNENRTKFELRHYDLSISEAITFDEKINFKYESGKFNIGPKDND